MSMTRRERLMATLRGEPVDRPPVSLYEVGGFKADPSDPDPFNVYNDPSWRPLLQLAEERTDLIRMRKPPRSPSAARGQVFQTRTWIEGGCRMTSTRVAAPHRMLTSLTKREPGVDTVWEIEHLLKDTDDLAAFLDLPDEVFAESVDVASLKAEDEALGDRGIVMVNMEDPLCAAASLFSMEDYTIIATTEPDLFHRLLEKCARHLYAVAEKTAREFPGRLWRIVGSEYASEPFLRPALYAEYEGVTPCPWCG